MICTYCEGKGTIESLVGAACAAPASKCCGGCTHDTVCPECRGTGEERVECLRCLASIRLEDAVVLPELAPMRFCAPCAAKARVSIAGGV